ncbi:MAG: retropepsin-like aspartic protease [Acidobacteriota bacterium]
MPRTWLSFTPNSIPVVSVHIAGCTYKAMVDSGASFSQISPDLTLLLGLPRKGRQPIISVHGDIQNKSVVYLPVIGLAEHELPPCKATVTNLSALRLGIDLILGVNAFKNRRLHIDFKEGRVYVFPER